MSSEQTMSNPSTDAFWCRPLDTLLAETQSRPAGLTAAEAAERLARVGPNAVAPTPHRRLAVKIARRFAEPLVAILLVAAAISGFTGDIGQLRHHRHRHRALDRARYRAGAPGRAARPTR